MIILIGKRISNDIRALHCPCVFIEVPLIDGGDEQIVMVLLAAK